MNYKEAKKFFKDWKWEEVEEYINRYRKIMMVENSTGRIHYTLSHCNCVKAVVNNCEQAVGLYFKNDYDCIMLDYNLSRIWNIFSSKTSLDLAKSIANDDLRNLKLVVIHSWNPFGRKKLYNLINSCGVDIILYRHKKIF